MICRRTLLGSLLLFLLLSCYSQTDSLISRNTVSSEIRISYNSSLIYPGIKLGFDFPVYSVDLNKIINKKDRGTVIKDRFISIYAAWYHHPEFHDNLYFTAEWTMRRTHKKGFFTEFSSGLGYSRTFLGGTTYEVNRSGDVDIVKGAGYNYAIITAGAGLGFNFSEWKAIPLSVFHKFSMLTMFPYNSTIYFRPVMELGLIYRPENFIPFQIKKKISRR